VKDDRVVKASQIRQRGSTPSLANDIQGVNLMELLLAIILVIGLAGVIGNQYSIIKRMEGIESILREIRDKR
jgi:hypothetical protein